MNKVCLGIFFIGCSLSVLAQSEATPKSEMPEFSHQYTFLDIPYYYFIDTTFRKLEYYHRFNNTFRDLFGRVELGNIGAPLNSVVYNNETDIWHYHFLGAYKDYFLNENDVPFYQVRSPLTDATYWMGYNRGQAFRILHTQNIKPYWNIAIRFKRLNALGQYNNSRNTQSLFLASSRYFRPEKGMSISGYYLQGKLEAGENGGIQNDTLFEASAPANKLLVPVNLERDQNILRKQEFFLDQSYNLLKVFSNIHGRDTSSHPEDSATLTGKSNSVEAESHSKNLSLGHQVRYTRVAKTYLGSSEDFYRNYYFSEPGDQYRDSVSTREMENTIYLKTEIGSGRGFMLKAGLRYLQVIHGNSLFETSFGGLGVTGSLEGKIGKRLKINGDADFIFAGELASSYNFTGNAEYKLLKTFSLNGGIALSSQLPSTFFQLYRSNNYIWNQSFDFQNIQSLHYGITWNENTAVTVSHSRHDGFIYFNEEARPAQVSESLNIFKVDVKQNFTLWGFLHQDNRIVFQQVGGDGSYALPLPDLVTRNSLYFEFTLFKGALKVFSGAELNYFSEYFSPKYSPALGDFYVSRERTIGDYPLIDVFANFQIRKALIFVKYEHVNEGFTGFNFYAAPHYPFPDRTLRVGINWRFFN